jgi:hypothetical protein
MIYSGKKVDTNVPFVGHGGQGRGGEVPGFLNNFRRLMLISGLGTYFA